ncbi:glycosyltransferase family 2 protein [Oerskovia enterophila]|uniref:Beta-monoglucosyldiacylglycerol synthase n=1 Tax=Oerskovia enterophila TaxID=43678 RepID=A0A163QMT3_9CELL|nr:glycosyltransferase family 2 protein [Oerskovia enterophila]KZM34339.1 beta-monoglucosyldiacylglycerol synthase [Oerskovia enterophila]OCI29602.1 beta-monoglucosyldiacylglycerol synthase [Oerskovia enterophila]
MQALNVLASIVICLSMVYFVMLMGSGLTHLRRRRTRLGVQGDTTYGQEASPAHPTLRVYFMVPCLNEEEVIGLTVAGLTRLEGATTLVIDDGSDDETAARAEAAGGDRVEILRRVAPDARKGKGEALNAGIARIRDLVAERGEDPDDVVVCVMDADGRLSDGALEAVLPLFEDPTVGGAQLQVRIRNRHAFLTRYQDYQFWGIAAVTQFGRLGTGTVSLGGNGQFARLSALDDAGPKPWSASLTEDLDLAITLAMKGWELTTTPDASVDQQAVEKLGLLVKQRTRWYQGHMMAITRLPEIWRSPELSNAKALELSAYCLVPWILDLPWSFFFHYCLVMVALNHEAVFAFTDQAVALVIVGVVWYLLAFAPALITGWIYWRRDRRWSLWKCLLMGNSFVVMNYLSFTCVWRALLRILRGQTSWDKTARVREKVPDGAAPAAPSTIGPRGPARQEQEVSV